MTADIARITYDPTRQYRSLIYQQGRVTLEADNNEAAVLASEALRLETIDIIGPTGALGSGFEVFPGPNGYSVRKGIFYLGGWRLQLDEDFPVHVYAYPEHKLSNIAIALLLTEQSVSAVEDQALREVALGGPDSAARCRLMQNFVTIPSDAISCAGGWNAVLGELKAQGVTVDDGLELHSTARLLAGFAPGPASADPCTPSAAGGYLGADNQMVRVTVTGYIPGSGQKGGSGTLLWGWNNASLLYRATAANATTLNLTTLPVDQEHAPQLGQWVEVLLSELDLLNGNYVAAGQGFVTWVTSGYVAAGDPVVLNDSLPADYQSAKNPLFLRLWQAQVDFNDGEATPLDSVSGIEVTLTLKALPPTNDDGTPRLAARPFWHFSVRPSMPVNIYPERYALVPQPPEGPRQWITDLAVLTQDRDLADCRVPYPKPDENGCCGLTLDVAGVAALGGLQAVVDGLAGSAAVLSLRTGIYPLTAPLQLNEKNSGLTIEGCNAGVIISASASDLSAFSLGLVELEDVNSISLRQLTFEVPQVAFNSKEFASLSIGLSINGSERLTIENCSFVARTTGENPLGGMILLEGPNRQGVLRGNRFAAGGGTDASIFGIIAMVSATQDSSVLDQWEITDNLFAGLQVAIFALIQLGLIRCCRNVVSNCQGGFLFMDIDLASASGFTSLAMKQAASGKNVQLGNAAYSVLRPDLLTDTVNKFSPILANQAAKAAPKLSAVANRALRDQAGASGASVYNSITAGMSSATGIAADEKNLAAQPAAITVDTKIFDQINKLAIAGETYELEIEPAIRIDDNEITLIGPPAAAAIGVAMSFDEPGSVMVSGNRAVVPDATTTVCGVMGCTAAVVTGNMFWQKTLQKDGETGKFALIVLAGSAGLMVSGNVSVFAELIAPARPAPASTSTWEFLNMVAV